MSDKTPREIAQQVFDDWQEKWAWDCKSSVENDLVSRIESAISQSRRDALEEAAKDVGYLLQGMDDYAAMYKNTVVCQCPEHRALVTGVTRFIEDKATAIRRSIAARGKGEE